MQRIIPLLVKQLLPRSPSIALQHEHLRQELCQYRSNACKKYRSTILPARKKQKGRSGNCNATLRTLRSQVVKVLTSTSCAVLHGTHVVAHVLEVLLSVHRDRSIVVVIIVVVGTRTPIVVAVTEVVTSSTAHPAICHHSWTHLGEPVATIRTRRVLGRDIRVRMVVRIHCYGRSQLEADASCAFFLERERVRRRTRWSLPPALPLRLFR